MSAHFRKGLTPSCEKTPKPLARKPSLVSRAMQSPQKCGLARKASDRSSVNAGLYLAGPCRAPAGMCAPHMAQVQSFGAGVPCGASPKALRTMEEEVRLMPVRGGVLTVLMSNRLEDAAKATGAQDTTTPRAFQVSRYGESEAAHAKHFALGVAVE